MMSKFGKYGNFDEFINDLLGRMNGVVQAVDGRRSARWFP
jgi:hypothetical protein